MCDKIKKWTGKKKASYYFEKIWLALFIIVSLVIVFIVHPPFLQAILEPFKKFLKDSGKISISVESFAWMFFYLVLVFTIFWIVKELLFPYEKDNDEILLPTRPEAVLEQYKQTQENQRSLVRLLWELPTIAIAISTAFLVVSYNFFGTPTPENFLLRSSLLFFGWLLMFVVFLAVVKHRHFRGVWLEYLKKLENKLGLTNVPMHTNPTKKTSRYKNTNLFHKFFLTFRAEEWLANVIFLISVIFATLSIYNFYQFLVS